MAVGQLTYQRAPVAGQPVRLALRPAGLAGREMLLTELDARLSGSDDSGPRTVVLRGLGGAGKTSVAVEYAHRHLAEVGVAWQFAAEDPAVLAAGFGELAAQLGARDIVDTRDPVATVHRVLATYPAGWLLIFDNAPDRASVAAFLPPAGLGQVLITSQNQNWPPSQVLDVPVLVPEVAAEFLADRTGRPDQQAAVELAVALGGLPLALEQASAYIVAAGDTLAGYLASFRQRRVDLLSRGEPTGYPKTVATTWILAFDRLERSTPVAAGLLRLLAYCAPEKIPLRLLLGARPLLAGQLGPQVASMLIPLLEDPLAVKDSIAALRRYSLVSPAADGAVSVHRLVQAVTGDLMSSELAGEWRKATAALIEAAIPAAPGDPQAWPTFAELLPHAQAALAAGCPGMERIAAFVGSSGSYAAARELQQKVLGARLLALDAGDPLSLTARSNLAYWTGAAGDPAGARNQLAALLPVLEQVLGPEDPVFLTAESNLAYWTGVAGDAAGARHGYAALLPVLERILGAGDSMSLTARSNLARWTGAAGDAAGARDQCTSLLFLRKQAFGSDHPGTLNTWANLAAWTGEAGDFAAAVGQFAALLPVQERVLGAEHPETLVTRHNLAVMTGKAGDPAAACAQFAALLPVREKVLGPDHPDTLTTRGNLAHWTGVTGDAAGACDQFAALLPVQERVLGAQHPETLATRHNLAGWTGEAGDPVAACAQFAAVLLTREKNLGPDHPDTLTTRGSLAHLVGVTGDAAGARDQLCALLPVLERIFGAEHPLTLAARYNLAGWTSDAGDLATAVGQFAALLPMQERVLGTEHPETVATRRALAHLSGGEYNEAS